MTMDEFKPVLKYIKKDLAMQKQALYALQYLMHKMEHPNSMSSYF